MPGTFWGALVVALIAGFFFVRSLVKPRIVQGSWAPVVHANIGDFTVYAANNQARVNYYALLLLITAPIPAVMFAATTNQGDSTFYWREKRAKAHLPVVIVADSENHVGDYRQVQGGPTHVLRVRPGRLRRATAGRRVMVLLSYP
jgi:hypothetical protein